MRPIRNLTAIAGTSLLIALAALVIGVYPAGAQQYPAPVGPVVTPPLAPPPAAFLSGL